MAAKRDYDYLFKLVIIGDSGVGKSSLLLRFADDTFQEAYISTIGVDFRYRTVNVDGKVVKLQIWDTAGQERFRTITAAYYRGCDGIIMVYDVTSRDSYTHVDHWFGEVTKFAMKTTSKLLIGNKIDAPDHRVTTADGEKLAAKLGIPFIETSAKTSKNVETAFVNLSRSLIAASIDGPKASSEPTVVIKPIEKKPAGGCDC